MGLRGLFYGELYLYLYWTTRSEEGDLAPTASSEGMTVCPA